MWKGVLPLLLLTIRLASSTCLYPPCPKLDEPECPRLDCSVESLEKYNYKIELHVNWTCCESTNKNFTVSYHPRESCECSQFPSQLFSTTGCEIILESRCLSSTYDIVITHVSSNSSCHEIYKTLPQGVRTLTAVALKGNLVRLQWSSSWYRGNWSFLVRWIAPDGHTNEQRTNQQRLNLGPLDHDTNYTFQVQSCDCNYYCSDFQTTWATTWSVGPNAPLDVHGAKITSEQILVRWKRPPPRRRLSIFAGYVIHLQDEEDEIILPSSALKYRFLNLMPSTNYTIVIFAFSTDGEKRLDGPKVTLFSRTAEEDASLSESLDKFKGELLLELRSLLKEELCK